MASISRSKAFIANQARPRIIRSLLVISVVILIASSWAWWHSVRSNPSRVFEGMLANNLKTIGVTDRLQESDGNQNVDQMIQLMTTPLNAVHAKTTLTQVQQDGSPASVITETVGTPTTDYVRYLDIQTGQKDAAGKPFDFSKVKNVWGKSTTSNSERSTNGELYNQSVLAVVPLANLPAQKRRTLLQQIQQNRVYEIDYSGLQREIRNGRPEYIYPVTIKPEPYVNMLKTFARYLGLTQLENIDTANYANAAPIEVLLSVDVWTKNLTKIAYAGGGRTETFSAHGGQFNISEPNETISIEELQTRIQSLR